MAFVEMLKTRALLKAFAKYKAFTPDRAVDVEDIVAELLGTGRRRLAIDHRRLEFWSEVIRRSPGVREVNGKVYLDIRKYFKNLLLYCAIGFAAALNVFIILSGGLIRYGALTLIFALFLVAVLAALIECQPLLSYIIASKTRKDHREDAD